MITKRNILFDLVIVIALVLTLTGCPDMGDYETDKDMEMTEDNFEEYYKGYFDSFGDVIMYDYDNSSESYSMEESFFTYDNIQNFTWNSSKGEVEVPFKNYAYMAIEVDRDINLGSLTLFVKKDNPNDLSTTELYIYLYISDDDEYDEIPDYNCEAKDLENLEDFDLPTKDSAIGSDYLSVNSSYFTSFTISNWSTGRTVKVEDGQYIILVFYNNTAYGRLLEDKPLTPVSFQALDLMIENKKI